MSGPSHGGRSSSNNVTGTVGEPLRSEAAFDDCDRSNDMIATNEDGDKSPSPKFQQ